MNPYLRALESIPAGETRSFMELAAMAGRPGAARAAGRAVRQSLESSAPWQRVVSADGRLWNEERQLRRLRREGARPRARESVEAWSHRVGARFIGTYRGRRYVPRGDERVARWDPCRVEAFSSEATARARGFAPHGASVNAREPLPLPEKACVVSDAPTRGPLRPRLETLDWGAIRARLDAEGAYRLESLLDASECASILNASTTLGRFERSIDMLSRGYGVGAYHYYAEPLPRRAQVLRDVFYRKLSGHDDPATLNGFWDRCRAAGQKRASTILIGYGEGGVNHPHKDIYGRVFFPFQALLMLSKRGRDFDGGEFYVEDDTGERSFAVDLGDVVLFSSQRRHGMTPVSRGRRWGMGIVFHLAE